MKYNNPETLKYSIGQKVTWQERDGSVHQGIVINVGYNGLDILQDVEEIQVPFDLIINRS
jgi:plastocyanin